jgi:hypothetical protein
MQPFRMPPHVAAMVITALLLLFLAGLVFSSLASRRSHPVAPFAPHVDTPFKPRVE